MYPSRGRRFGPAFIAVLVVLAGSAGTIGYLVTRQVMDAQAAAGLSGGPTQPGGGGSAPGQTSPGGTPATDTTVPPGTKDCLSVTEQAAKDLGSPGGLKQVLYVRTSRSEVWICKDSAGVLWYQGHSPRDTRITAATSASTLFLQKVEPEGDGFVAVNTRGDRTTTYHIDRKEVRVEDPDAVEEVIFFE